MTTWWAVEVRPAPDDFQTLAAWLVTATGQAVVERDDGVLVAHADDEAAADALIARVHAEHPLHAAAVKHPVEPVDWSVQWREGIEPRQFGRLVVHPSWAEGTPDGEVSVMLDPETAFGSGEHGSTRVALALLEELVRPDDFVLDVGSGSGILAIAAVKLGAERAVGVEVDEEANEVAERNAERNGVAEQTAFLAGDAKDLIPLLGPADLIVSNILRTVNVDLLDVIGRALKPGGFAVFSGMEEAERTAFLHELKPHGFEAEDELVDEGWWGVAVRRT